MNNGSDPTYCLIEPKDQTYDTRVRPQYLLSPGPTESDILATKNQIKELKNKYEVVREGKGVYYRLRDRCAITTS